MEFRRLSPTLDMMEQHIQVKDLPREVYSNKEHTDAWLMFH